MENKDWALIEPAKTNRFLIKSKKSIEIIHVIRYINTLLYSIININIIIHGIEKYNNIIGSIIPYCIEAEAYSCLHCVNLYFVK